MCAASVTKIYLTRLSSVSEPLFLQLLREASDPRRTAALRYARREDATRCVVGGALLRYALCAAGIDPDIEVLAAAGGKPYVDRQGIHFNVSHGGEWIALGFGGAPLGVDVEPIKPYCRHAGVAQRYFTPAEQACLTAARASGEQAIDRCFTLLWTRKESYVKYTGEGLCGALSSFSVDDVLPVGRVTDADGVRCDLGVRSLFPDSEHVLSLCSTAHRSELAFVDAAALCLAQPPLPR